MASMSGMPPIAVPNMLARQGHRQVCVEATSLICAAGRAPRRSCLFASMRSVAPTSFSSFSSPCSSSLHRIEIVSMCCQPAAEAVT